MLFGVLILISLSVPLLGKLAVASGGGDKREDGEKEAEAKREVSSKFSSMYSFHHTIVADKILNLRSS